MEQIGADWWTGGGLTKQSILNEIKGKTIKAINLYISSPGGDVDEALAIKDLLIGTKATITAEISGLTASAATIIMLAAGTIKMSEDSMLLIHNASTWSGGNKEDLRKTADTLEKIDNLIADMYTKKSGKPKDEFVAQMTKNQWMTPDEAIAMGIVNEKISKVPVSAKAKIAIKNAVDKKFITLPENYKLEDSKHEDMAEKKSAQNIILDFLKGIKDAGMKIISDEAKTDPKAATKKITDLTDAAVKAIENFKPENEETTEVTNAADYSATVTDPVDSIELVDGSAIDLPNAPYEVTADGATALQTDITAATTGTAKSVTVAFSEADTNLTITVKGSDVEFDTVNGSVKFTVTQNAAEGDTPENLKKKIAALDKKIADEKKKPDAESEEVKNLKAQLLAKNKELLKIKTSKSGGNNGGDDLKNLLDGKDKPDGVAPGEAAMLNMFDKRYGKNKKG